jgi:hypothetical protein
VSSLSTLRSSPVTEGGEDGRFATAVQNPQPRCRVAS